jgi:hypothetical protein
MSFSVFLIESSASPPTEVFAAHADAALTKIRATGSVTRGDVVTNDGWSVGVYCDRGQGGMVKLQSLTLSIAELIFAVADATCCYIVSEDNGTVALRTHGNVGTLAMSADDEDKLKIVDIENPTALEAKLSEPFGAWSGYRDQILKPDASASPSSSSFFGRLLGGLFGKAT